MLSRSSARSTPAARTGALTHYAMCSPCRAVQTVSAVDHSVVPFFREAAKKLLATIDEPEVALALALAKITGHTAMKARSLLTAHEGFTTVMYTGEQQVGC